MLKSFTGVSQIGDIESLFVFGFFSFYFPRWNFIFATWLGCSDANRENWANQQKYKATRLLPTCCSQITELPPKSGGHRTPESEKAVRRERAPIRNPNRKTQHNDTRRRWRTFGGLSDKIRSAPALICHTLPGGDRRAPQTARDSPGR